MENLVQLDGEILDIEGLFEVLPTTGWQIRKEDNCFYLVSDQLNHLQVNREIIAKAQEILDLLNGAANIIYENHKSVTPGSIVKVNKNGKRNHVLLTGPITFRLRLVKDSGCTAELLEIPWLDVSTKNNIVRDVLLFFSELTWFNLYKIYEVICKDIGGETQLIKFMTQSELVSFRQTAQSRQAIGKHARHGKKIPAPKKIMTFDDACKLWRRVLSEWIKSK
jgi:hypothetical protein